MRSEQRYKKWSDRKVNVKIRLDCLKKKEVEKVVRKVQEGQSSEVCKKIYLSTFRCNES